MLGTIGRRVLERAFENSVKAIEVRNSAPKRLVTGNSNLDARTAPTRGGRDFASLADG